MLLNGSTAAVVASTQESGGRTQEPWFVVVASGQQDPSGFRVLFQWIHNTIQILT